LEGRPWWTFGRFTICSWICCLSKGHKTLQTLDLCFKFWCLCMSFLPLVSFLWITGARGLPWGSYSWLPIVFGSWMVTLKSTIRKHSWNISHYHLCFLVYLGIVFFGSVDWTDFFGTCCPAFLSPFLLVGPNKEELLRRSIESKLRRSTGESRLHPAVSNNTPDFFAEPPVRKRCRACKLSSWVEGGWG